MKSVRMLLALGLLGFGLVRGDEAAATPAGASAASVPVTDPARVGAHYREVLARPQFEEIEEPAVNSRFEDWLSQWFKRLGATIGDFKYASRMPAFESLLMTSLVVMSISILLYIMARLTRRRGSMERDAGDDVSPRKIFRAPESYDEEIHLAVRAGDWHGAWLAAWRQFLSRLERRSLVEADRTRTNREYLAQLRDKSLPLPALGLLVGLVDAYDRFIYGRQAIAESDWTLFHRQMDEAGLLLHLQDRAITAKPEPHT